MRRLLTATCLSLSSFSSATAQSADPASPPIQVKVYAKEPGLIAPQLRPLTLPPLQIDKCIRKIDGDVELSLLVDTGGVPRNIMFIHPVGSDADVFALKIAAADRFTPGVLDGKPVVTAASLKVKIQACVIEVRRDNGAPGHTGKLRAPPVQELLGPVKPPEVAILAPDVSLANGPAGSNAQLYKIGGSVSVPIPLIQPDAEFSEEARARRVSGSCSFSLVVDTHGMPQRVQETKTLGYGLDENALAAISKYRFKPAMKDGEPVPVSVNVEVNFIRRD